MPDDNLPRWDLTSLLAPLGGGDRSDALLALDRLVAEAEDALTGLMQDGSDARSLDRYVSAFDVLLRHFWTIETLLLAPLVTDSRDEAAHQQWSAFEPQRLRLRILQARFTTLAGTLDIEQLSAKTLRADSQAFLLRRAALNASHQLPGTEESLASTLLATGAGAWQRLYGAISSQLRVEVHLEDEPRPLPQSRARALVQNGDRATRRAAHEGEVQAWERVSLPVAAALNSVKGHALTLGDRRGWATLLDAACFANQIDRATLDAMLRAVQDGLPELQRYLRVKANLLELEQLAWYDLSAPVGKSRRRWQYPEAKALTLHAFERYSQRLAAVASRAFEERWIDAEPRAGKQNGGLCLSFPDGSSRITVSYVPAWSGVRQLAHELGHAFHNHLLIDAGRSLWQWSETPPVLAESVAIFCETLVQEAVLEEASVDDRLYILDAALQNASRFVIDGLSSLLFEERMLALRRKRELSVAELNDLMLQCQREAYGAALDPTALHPFMWASRPHAFVPEATHAALPYMFGQLFSSGLFARYRTQPETFPVTLDTVFASASTADIPTLASHLDIDLHDEAFWRASIDSILRNVERFEHTASSG